MLAIWDDFWQWSAPPPFQAPSLSNKYTYINLAQARTALASRLLSSGSDFWSVKELNLYIVEAMRTWNALTGVWQDDMTAQVTSSTAAWIKTHVTGLRPYTLTDDYLYRLVQYHLLEPATGAATWTGTSQFSLSDLTAALQRRQDEIVQLIAANMDQAPAVSLSGRRAILIDTLLDVRRARFVPNPGLGNPQTLGRGDLASFRMFSPNYLQTPQTPRNYSLSNQPPLTLDVDFSPNVTGQMDLLAVNASLPPSPPAAIPLVIPDDWTWVLKWGVLADLLGKVSEAQDIARANYCMARYQEGITLAQSLPWLIGASLNNVPCGITGVDEKDKYDYGWETPALNANPRNGVVVAGVDLLSICPRPAGATTIGLTLRVVANAPVPATDGSGDGTFLQVSRDTWDDILDYAVHLAMFKCGGAEFAATMPLFDNFRKSAQLTNQRLANLGSFDDLLKREGQRAVESDPRFASPPVQAPTPVTVVSGVS